MKAERIDATFHAAPTLSLATVGRMFSAMLSVADQRRALSSLDAAALKDIGVSPFDAQAEATKPFWDLPRR